MTGFSKLSNYPNVNPFEATFRPVDFGNCIKEAQKSTSTFQLNERTMRSNSASPKKGMKKQFKTVDHMLKLNKKLNKLMKSEPTFDGRRVAATDIWC